jgi:hypothetical protein
MPKTPRLVHRKGPGKLENLPRPYRECRADNEHQQETADGGKKVSQGPLGTTKITVSSLSKREAMQNDRQTREVREHVHQVFLQHGVDKDALIEEAILIRDGFYCGRRYECESFQAIWFVEEDQLKIYNEQGVVQKTSVTAILQTLQKAA